MTSTYPWKLGLINVNTKRGHMEFEYFLARYNFDDEVAIVHYQSFAFQPTMKSYYSEFKGYRSVYLPECALSNNSSDFFATLRDKYGTPHCIIRYNHSKPPSLNDPCICRLLEELSLPPEILRSMRIDDPFSILIFDSNLKYTTFFNSPTVTVLSFYPEGRITHGTPISNPNWSNYLRFEAEKDRLYLYL